MCGKCRNNHQPATFVCNHCNKSYCDACQKSHKKRRPDHEIKYIAEHAHMSDKITVDSTINYPTCNDPLRQEISDQHLCQNQINLRSVSYQRNESLVDSQTNETIVGKGRITG